MSPFITETMCRNESSVSYTKMRDVSLCYKSMCRKEIMLLLHNFPDASYREPKQDKMSPNACYSPKDFSFFPYLSIRKYLFSNSVAPLCTYCLTAGEEPMESPINGLMRTGVHSVLSPSGAARLLAKKPVKETL